MIFEIMFTDISLECFYSADYDVSFIISDGFHKNDNGDWYYEDVDASFVSESLKPPLKVGGLFNERVIKSIKPIQSDKVYFPVWEVEVEDE